MLDRRSLLKLSAAGAVTLGTGIRVAIAQDKPKRGGTLTVGRNHDADTLYPGRSTGLSAIATNLLLYDGLVLHDFQMKIRPALAERWEVSGDGLLLPVEFDADDGGVGGTTKAADVAVNTKFRPRVSITGPGF